MALGFTSEDGCEVETMDSGFNQCSMHYEWSGHCVPANITLIVGTLTLYSGGGGGGGRTASIDLALSLCSRHCQFTANECARNMRLAHRARFYQQKAKQNRRWTDRGPPIM